MRRRSRGPDISFFAFQDIITAVVGIFILITIILALEFIQRVEASVTAATPAVDARALERTLQQLQAEIERMEAEYAKRLDQRQNQVEINSFNRDARMKALKAEIMATRERIALADTQLLAAQQQMQAADASETTLLNQLAQLQSERERLTELEQAKQSIEAKIQQFTSHDGLLYRDKSDEGRFLCLVTLKNRTIVIQDAATKSTRTWEGNSRVRSLEAWLDAQSSSPRHFLLLVMPQGAEDFEAVREILEAANGAFGYDVIGDQQSVKLRFEMETRP